MGNADNKVFKITASITYCPLDFVSLNANQQFHICKHFNFPEQLKTQTMTQFHELVRA